MSEEWMLSGKCRDMMPALFFADHLGGRAGGNLNQAAKRVCGGCPVVVECLEYALSLRIPHGVFGGATPRERGEIIRARGRRRVLTNASSPRSVLTQPKTGLRRDAGLVGGPTDFGGPE